MNRLTMAALASLCTFNTYAQTDSEPLEIEAELGVLLTSGNTQSTALSSTVNVRHELTHWRNSYMAQGLYKEDEVARSVDGVPAEESQVSAERYFLSAQTDYKLDKEHGGLFLFGSYEEDKFSGYDFQSALAAGYSDRLFQSPYAYFDYSVGPGFSFSRTSETLDNGGSFIDNQSEESAILRFSAFYQYEFGDSAKFTQSLASDAALESGANTKSKSVTAITAKINHSFALKASLTVTHNTQVPEIREHTDTITSVSLVYSLN